MTISISLIAAVAIAATWRACCIWRLAKEAMKLVEESFNNK